MGKSKKEKVEYFRYGTGDAKVPWATVGEGVGQKDVVKIVRFLCEPAKGKNTQYNKQFKKVTAEIENLFSVGQPARKLTLGGHVISLEKKMAKFLGSKYTSFITNATAGFEMGFKYAGIGPGDEVIAPSITFIATIGYPLSIGAKVVFADVDPRTINMDPKDVERKITPRTKAIIPVHVGGYPVDMAPIMKLARKHNITVIEDAAHAFGAQYHGKMIGTLGHFGSFSFHEVKNITSLGEGGILTTNLPIGKQFYQARFLGRDRDRKIHNWLYDVVALKGKSGLFFPGNHSSTEIQALALSIQMNRIKKIIAKRRKAAAYLNRRFKNVEGIIPQLLDTDKIKAAYHLYLLQIDPTIVGGDIQLFKKKLTERRVVQIAHFAPLYKFTAMKQFGYDIKAIEKTCPVTEEIFNHRFTHLPLYDFNDEQLKYMADMVIESIEEMKNGK